MYVLLVLLFVLSQTNSAVTLYNCSKSVNNSVSFTPANDGVKGRYTVATCLRRDPNFTSWNVELWYYEDEVKCCNHRRPKFTHSQSNQFIVSYTNSSHVCYSMDFDLIFSGCYKIRYYFEKIDGRKSHFVDNTVVINNNITLDDYKKNKPLVVFMPNEVESTLRWHLGLPVSEYEVTLGPQKKEEDYCDHCYNITNNCSTVAWDEVICLLKLPVGCYLANFHHYALWSSVLNEQTSVDYHFCRNAVKPPEAPVGEGSSRVLWACGAVLLAAVVAVALLVARRTVLINNYHKRVLQAWLSSREREPPQSLNPTNPTILLLYAREGEHGQRAVAALKELLEEVTEGQVLELYAPEVTALASCAPGAWLHGTLLSPHTKVLLLQSPAAAALYAAPLHDNSLTLQEPLLGRRAMYRCPQFGDQLLHLALRLLTETVSAHNSYNKFYLATYGTLETDLVPQVVPYRRYVLPGATLPLARDLAALDALRDEHAPLVERCCHAAEQFVRHATDHPDYLLDELVLM